GELRVAEQRRDYRVDVVDRSLREVPLAVRPQLVEQLDDVTCANLRQQQVTGLGQDVVLEPALVAFPVEVALPTLDDPLGRERAHGAHMWTARCKRGMLHLLRALGRRNPGGHLVVYGPGKIFLPHGVTRRCVAPLTADVPKADPQLVAARVD